jgi:hypothetical protein
MYSKVYSCTNCLNNYTARSAVPSIIICDKCNSVIHNTTNIYLSPTDMPDDWSFIQIGTTGTDIDKKFEVIGRTRLQLRNEYKNYWTILYSDNTTGFLYESFGSLVILGPEMHAYNDDLRKLKAGSKIKKQANLTLVGDFVEKCESLAFEGEISNWKEIDPGFFVVQTSSIMGYAAVFHIHSVTEVVYYYYGKKMTLENLKLQNILQWNEWK